MLNQIKKHIIEAVASYAKAPMQTLFRFASKLINAAIVVACALMLIKTLILLTPVVNLIGALLLIVVLQCVKLAALIYVLAVAYKWFERKATVEMLVKGVTL